MGDGNLTPAPWLLCCPIQSDTCNTVWNSHNALEKLSGRCLWGRLAKASSLQDQTAGFSPHSELGTSPYSKGLNALSWRRSLGCYSCHHTVHTWGGACSRVHRSHHFWKPWDLQESDQQNTIRLWGFFPHWGFSSCKHHAAAGSGKASAHTLNKFWCGALLLYGNRSLHFSL